MKRITKGERIDMLLQNERERAETSRNFDTSTGTKPVDAVIGGFKFGELVVIAARPAMGKTKFLLRSLLRISAKVPVLYCSLDNNKRRIANKVISLKKDGGLSFFIDHIGKYESQVKLENERLFVSDSIFDSMEEYLLLLLHHIVNDDVKVIAIDELQLLPLSNSRITTLEMLKEICDMFNVTIIVTSGVKPDCELRGGDKKPRLNDITIQPSQVCLLDVVLLLYRPEYYGIIEDQWGNSTAGRLEVIIAKDREKEPFDQTVECLFTPKLDKQESH